jgi:3-phenylpropionate/trans-cinnamate dioxygenase ferredoxin subunit
MVVKKIGSAHELAYNRLKGVEIDGTRILVVNLAGNFFAIGDTCTHMGCKLSGGKLDGETVRCPCHGSLFSIRTGEVVKGPAKNPEPAYAVTDEKGELSIDM